MKRLTPPSLIVTPWKIISSKLALPEKWFTVRRDIVELPSGRQVDDYFVWEAPHIVMTVPVTAEGNVIIVRQYRHAIKTITYQFPAGAVDKGETNEQAAQRELEEEAGFQAESLTHLGCVASYATKVTGTMDIYLARNAVAGGQRHEDDMEETEVFEITPDELRELLSTHDIQQADFVAAAYMAFNELSK
jgi:ADP-ribose pyrophosphatase